MRVVLSLYLLFSSLVLASPVAELTAQAQQQNSNAQYQLALAYQQGDKVAVNLNNAFYWFQQAAQNGHPLAKSRLVNLYLKGQGTPKDIPQALFWLTDLATSGDVNAQLQLARTYETLPSPPSALELSEMWYRIAASKSSQAEEGYARVLQEKFNQQRAKQVSSISQLDSAFDSSDEADMVVSTAPVEHDSTSSIMTDYLSLLLLMLLLLMLIYLFRFWSRKRKTQQDDKNSQHLQEIESQAFMIRQQKRQLESLFKEIKRLQNNHVAQSQDQKLLLACALFGFKPSELPDEKSIRLRYKQLCKIYHPDLQGSQEEMKRLNGALKIILPHVK